MLIGRLTTMLQEFPIFGFGMGLTSVIGVAFAYMPTPLMIGARYGIAVIFGVRLVAGFASVFIGLFIGRIRKLSPR